MQAHEQYEQAESINGWIVLQKRTWRCLVICPKCRKTPARWRSIHAIETQTHCGGCLPTTNARHEKRKTFAFDPLSTFEKQQVAIDMLEVGDTQKPKTRADCINGPRPCPWVSCKYHLFLDVSKGGSIIFNFPSGTEVENLEHSCVLDLTEREHTLEECGQLFGLTRERIRQVELMGLHKLHRNLKRWRQAEELHDAIRGEVSRKDLQVPTTQPPRSETPSKKPANSLIKPLVFTDKEVNLIKSRGPLAVQSRLAGLRPPRLSQVLYRRSILSPEQKQAVLDLRPEDIKREAEAARHRSRKSAFAAGMGDIAR